LKEPYEGENKLKREKQIDLNGNKKTAGIITCGL
jgi:hypothetical protein